MNKIKRQAFKPLYKNFLKFRINIQERNKIFKFKKQKWKNFVHFYKKQIGWKLRNKPKSLLHYQVCEYPNRFNSYKRVYNSTLMSIKVFKLFYGNFRKRTLKNIIKDIKRKVQNEDKRLFFLKFFETRLDSVLYRAKFCESVRLAQQLILHKQILVNFKIVTNKNYQLKDGDLISLNSTYFNMVKKLSRETKKKLLLTRPIPPQNLKINYKTMQIVFSKIDENHELCKLLPIYLNLELIFNNYLKQ